MTQSADFWDGFDTYGPAGYVAVAAGVPEANSTLLTRWTSLWDQGPAVNVAIATADLTVTVVEALSEGGQALKLGANSNGQPGAVGLSKTLPANYERIIFGAHVMVPALRTSQRQGFLLGDGSTDQVGIGFNSSGQIEVRQGATNTLAGGVLLHTSDASITAGVAHTLKADVTISNASGIVKVWLDDHLVVNLSGVDTQISGNDTLSALRVAVNQTLASNFVNSIVVDHLYAFLYSSAGGGDAAPSASLIVQTDFPEADVSVDFTNGAAMLGESYAGVTSTNAPGANELFLRQFTPDVAGTLDSVSILPAAASATAKFKAVAYSDTAGAPDALLSTGPEVTGCTAGADLTGALTTPQALVAGTPVWIGFLTDTSIALNLTDAGVAGRKIARTYGLGAPATAGAMTASLPSWTIWGAVSGIADSWSLLDNRPFGGDLSYIASATPGDKAIYSFATLASTPTTIYGVALLAVIERSDAGARTIDLQFISAGVTGAGLQSGLSPATTYGTLESYTHVDPDTSAAWNASGVNLMTGGLKIAS